ncbi:MAG: tetratricopeptide repeat protein [Candidatus Poribacteria bacterium]|nr:tetratricopeptide repeat protein [Candidatus Poribacteria bacterium]MDE0504388.1 tetratricopeptide repeat protein [Candidatus Poribacteria bacterium]
MNRVYRIPFLLIVTLTFAGIGLDYTFPTNCHSKSTTLPDWIPQPVDLVLVSEPRLLQAAESAQKAVANAPDDAGAWGNLGNVYLVHGWEAEAARCYRRAANIDSAEFRWFYYLGLSTYKTDAQTAVDAFRKAIALDPDYPPVYVNHAHALRRLGRLEEARRHLLHVIELEPKNPFAEVALGELSLASKQFDDARVHLERALELNPAQSEAHAAMAQVALALGDKEAANRHAQAARRPSKHTEMDDPLWWEVVKVGVTAKRYAERGTRYLERGDFKNAATELAAAASSKPKDAEIWFNYGIVLLSINRYGKARKALEHALLIIDENDLEGGMSPKTPKEIEFLEIHSNYNLGYVYERTGDRVKAVAAYRRAIELKPDLAIAHAGLGVLYAKTGRIREGIAHCKQAIQLAPDDIKLQHSLATVYWQAKLYNNAAEVYDNVLQFDPDDKRALHQRGVIYMGKRMYSEAIEKFNRVLEIQPDDALAHGALGTAYLKIGNRAAAIAEFETVLRLDPNNRTAQRMLRGLTR